MSGFYHHTERWQERVNESDERRREWELQRSRHPETVKETKCPLCWQNHLSRVGDELCERCGKIAKGDTK